MEIVMADRSGELDAFVRAHPRGHFMQTSLWGRVKADWPWLGLICRALDGEIRGTMALLRHPLRLPRACLLYAPRGPILDPADYDVLRELVDAAVESGRALGACTGTSRASAENSVPGSVSWICRCVPSSPLRSSVWSACPVGCGPASSPDKPLPGRIHGDPAPNAAAAPDVNFHLHSFDKFCMIRGDLIPTSERKYHR